MTIQPKLWIRLSVLNLLIVSSLGVLMRYKIGFEFPHFEQKFLQHAHSHFAFAAWITQTLLVFLVIFIQGQLGEKSNRHYNTLLIINTVSAYGMLFSFIAQGYGVFSISFSQISIINMYLFAYLALKDLKSISNDHPALPWFKAALWFNVISSIGTYALAYMMVSRHILQNLYLGSVYFYLHFQYNGWFFFAAVGILIARLHKLLPEFKFNENIFRMFAIACVPAYLLSVLWLDLPIWVLSIVVVAAALQLFAWGRLLLLLRKAFGVIRFALPKYCSFIFTLVALSLSIKFLLQMGSTIPWVSKLAFGFRPIVIAYLHLVLLAVFTLFLLSYIHAFILENRNKTGRNALMIFAAGVYLNELILTTQGVASFSYTMIPYANEALFFVAMLMFTALLVLLISLAAKNSQQS